MIGGWHLAGDAPVAVFPKLDPTLLRGSLGIAVDSPHPSKLPRLLEAFYGLCAWMGRGGDEPACIRTIADDKFANTSSTRWPSSPTTQTSMM